MQARQPRSFTLIHSHVIVSVVDHYVVGRRPWAWRGARVGAGSMAGRCCGVVGTGGGRVKLGAGLGGGPRGWPGRRTMSSRVGERQVRRLAWVTRRAGGHDWEAQRLGGGFGQVAVQSNVAQSGGQRGGQGGQLQPGGVAAVVDRRRVAGAAGRELLHPVFDVGLGTVPSVEELDLAAGGVGDECAVLPVRVLAELGRLVRRSRSASV
jgi:hypothetical protein